MQNFHVKSVFLGLGLGIILTSMISMVYMAGASPNSSMSRSEIIEAAKQYGMVEESVLIKKESPKQSTVENQKKVPDVNPSSVPKGNTPSPTPVNQEVVLNITDGDTPSIVGEKLLDAGLISSKDSFVSEMSNMGKASDLVVGEYKIKKNAPIADIIGMISK